MPRKSTSLKTSNLFPYLYVMILEHYSIFLFNLAIFHPACKTRSLKSVKRAFFFVPIFQAAFSKAKSPLLFPSSIFRSKM